MISELRIRGLGVIEEAIVPFAPGLTVLTGETGAGKTMVLSGLGLIMGAALLDIGRILLQALARWRSPQMAAPQVEQEAIGKGSSRRAAEQQAANAVLNKLGVTA